AADVSRGSLAKAQDLIRAMGLEDRIETRLGDGLSVLKVGEANSIVIAGMGGILISQILEKDKQIGQAVDSLVLQPMTASRELRQWLSENNYSITKEDLVKEGKKIYELILAIPGNWQIENDIHLEIGKNLIKEKHPLLKEHISGKITKIRAIIAGLDQARQDGIESRLNDYRERLAQYMEVYNDL
ncbi:MAG: class I SAM-dependent methyltransferase, partial [Eubacteriales bacterium]